MKRPDFRRISQIDRARARSQSIDVERNFRVQESLYQQAVALGVWQQGDPLDGLDRDIRYARAINAPAMPRPGRPGA